MEAKVRNSTADALRQLAIDLKRQGISTTDCAIGFRTVNTIKRLGLVGADEEKRLESFVSDIYNKCKYYGLTPDKLVNLAMQILDLLESIPLSQIPNYLEEKSKDKQKLEEEIKKSYLRETHLFRGIVKKHYEKRKLPLICCRTLHICKTRL